MKDFNPGAGYGRRVGVPDNGLRGRQPQHNREAFVLDRHRLGATPIWTRHDIVFAAPHPNHDKFTRQKFRLSC
jgi:hypothetical protein